jgi:hypothetical protein
MISFTAKYISKIPTVKRDMDAKADQLVRWGAVTLQAQVRMSILTWPTGAIVDTGNMLGSVAVTFLEPKKAMVYVGAEYGHLVNNGTSKMAGRPFFDQAVKNFLPLYRGAVKQL